MKTQFMELKANINCLSEFDPALICHELERVKLALDFPPTCFRTSADPPKLSKSEGGNSPQTTYVHYRSISRGLIKGG